MGGCIRQVAALLKWLDYGVLETIVLYRLRRLGPLQLGCNREVAALLRFHCRHLKFSSEYA